jgi:beta-N-acetylhexosaminidase
MKPARWAIGAALCAGLLATSGGLVPGPTSGMATAATISRAQQVFNAMTDSQRVGQLMMIGCPSMSVSSTCATAIHDHHVGSVILVGNSTLSIAAEHTITAALQSHAPAHDKLFIATDQEGGLVRRMRGPGFTDYSPALTQGTWNTADLKYWASTWGRQLKAAGINLNLAPVLDTVPVGDTNNPPIGDLKREYSHHVATVSEKGIAVLLGLRAGGVSTTAKHFPGLGRVTANPDTSTGVTDTITPSTSVYLQPFAAAVAVKVPFVMVSTAIYTRIDATHPAAFSKRVIGGMLRTALGYGGVVISDDLGAAKQVSGYSVAARAIDFEHAGGDMILTVSPGQTGTMTSAILTRMKTDAAFAKHVRNAALRVLGDKQARGLLD